MFSIPLIVDTTNANIQIISLIITSLAAIITGGAGLKWYNSWQKNKREERTADSVAFRQNLLARISDMQERLEQTYTKQLELATKNAELRAELKAAHQEIAELRAEVKALRSKPN